MFLTNECDYAMRVIRALANGTKRTVKEIASEENIPERFAYKIIRKLRLAGYVRVTNGRFGGVSLRQPLETITLANLMNAIDSERYLNICLGNNSECVFKDNVSRKCAIHQELLRIQNLLMSALSSKTMDAML